MGSTDITYPATEARVQRLRIVKREVREVKSIVQFGEIKTGI